MAIHVVVENQAISREGVVVQFETTNDEYEGESETFSREFADGTTQQQVKDAVDAAVELYWLARGTPGWTI